MIHGTATFDLGDWWQVRIVRSALTGEPDVVEWTRIDAYRRERIYTMERGPPDRVAKDVADFVRLARDAERRMFRDLAKSAVPVHPRVLAHACDLPPPRRTTRAGSRRRPRRARWKRWWGPVRS